MEERWVKNLALFRIWEARDTPNGFLLRQGRKNAARTTLHAKGNADSVFFGTEGGKFD